MNKHLENVIDHFQQQVAQRNKYPNGKFFKSSKAPCEYTLRKKI